MIKDSTTKRHDNPIHHRILALICAVAIAMLQCAVLVSVDWDEVYAADDKVTVKVEVPKASGKSTERSYSKDDLSGYTETIDVETGDEDNPTKQVEVISGKKLKEKTGLPEGDINQCDIDDEARIAVDGFDTYYTKDGENWKENSFSKTVNIKMSSSYSPIKSIKLDPSSISLKDGGKETIKCIVKEGDSFFDGDLDKYLQVKWSNKSGSATGVEFSSNGNEATIKVTKAGTLTVTAEDKTSGQTATCQDSGANATMDISKATVTAEKQTYTGKPRTPQPTVKLNGKTLTPNTDFTWTYNNNTNVGNATIIVTGKGKYSGTATGTFKIEKETTKEPSSSKEPTTKKKPSKKNLDSDKTRVIKKEIAYYNNGKEVKPKFVVKYGDKTLKEGKDYTIEYSNNKNVGNDAKVTIKGKGDYTGEITRTFSITKKYTYNNNGGNGGGGHYPTRSSTVPPVTTGSTVPTETYAPDRSITVREVHLGQAIEPTQESQQNDSTLDDVLPDDQDNGRENPIEIEDPTVDFGPAASSAAVAVAACGLGAVGRIRKYRSDMGPVNEQIARALGFGGDGSAGSGDGNAAKSDAGKGKEGKKLFGRSAEKAAKDGAKAAGAAAAGTQAKKRKLPIPRRKDH